MEFLILDFEGHSNIEGNLLRMVKNHWPKAWPWIVIGATFYDWAVMELSSRPLMAQENWPILKLKENMDAIAVDIRVRIVWPSQVSTIVKILKIWSKISSNKNPINCILLQFFSLFYVILTISTIFSTHIF